LGGHQGSADGQKGNPGLLTARAWLRTPRAEISHTAARLLLSLMRGDIEVARHTDLCLELVQRESS
jgi:DNA-binding LacI/PurR family transcriptional regulator